MLFVDWDMVIGEPKSWGVHVDDATSDDTAILWGFARRIDAEIAVKFMASLPVDWLLPGKLMWRQVAAIGYADRDALMRACCERLQW